MSVILMLEVYFFNQLLNNESTLPRLLDIIYELVITLTSTVNISRTLAVHRISRTLGKSLIFRSDVVSSACNPIAWEAEM